MQSTIPDESAGKTKNDFLPMQSESAMTNKSPEGSLKSQAGPRFIDTFLQSPLAGLAPWIAMSLLSGPGRFEESVSTALGLSILFIYLQTEAGRLAQTTRGVRSRLLWQPRVDRTARLGQSHSVAGEVVGRDVEPGISCLYLWLAPRREPVHAPLCQRDDASRVLGFPHFS